MADIIGRARRPALRAALWAFALAAVSVGVTLARGGPQAGGASGPKAAQGPAVPAGARQTAEGWFAPIVPGVAAPELPRQVAAAFVIPIREVITSKTYDAIRRKVGRAKTSARLVVFDVDTPGGEGKAMLNIVRLITEDLAGIRTVAFVNPEAISAGAIISLACNEIAMVPRGTIGDAMPVMVGPQGYVPIPAEERGKIESYSRAQVRTLAKRNGYNVELCEAMVTMAMEIWLIRHRTTRELRMVDASEWRGKVAAVPATTQPGSPPAPAEVEWEYVRTIDGPMEVATLTADEAVFAGLCRHVLGSMKEVQGHYNIVGEPVVLEDTWSERLVEFLLSPAVVAALVFVGILCAYVEINTPGFGVPGTIAIICFAILFGSRYLVGLATWWEVGLFVLGLVLLAIEVFVTPGFGVMGIAGIVCCVTALLAMLVANPPDKLPLPRTELDWRMFTDGLMAIGVGLVCALVGAVLLARHLPKVPLAGRLVLRPPAPAAVAGGPATEHAAIRDIRPGAVGTVESTCRPVGLVRFGDALVDAVADGAFIVAGTKVKAIKNEGNRVVVTPVA